MDNITEIKEWRVYMKVAEFLRDILWRYHREKRIVKGTPKENFWDSLPMSELSPAQRKHLKAIMRKEVRKCH